MTKGFCAACSPPLKTRQARLEAFHTQTAPVIAHYKERVAKLNADKPAADVEAAIRKALAA